MEPNRPESLQGRFAIGRDLMKWPFIVGIILTVCVLVAYSEPRESHSPHSTISRKSSFSSLAEFHAPKKLDSTKEKHQARIGKAMK